MNQEITFEQYQSLVCRPWYARGFESVRVGVHRLSVITISTLEIPVLILAIMETSMEVLSFIPSLADFLVTPKLFLKSAKDYTNFIKGIRPINGILNFKFNWKIIVLNLSSLSLFIVSIVTVLGRFNLIDLKAFKATLATIPFFGILPFAGVLHASLVGLSASLLLLAWDKRKKIKKEEERINNKIEFWNRPLEVINFQARMAKYEKKISSLLSMIEMNEKLLSEGKQRERLFVEDGKENQLKVCRKALEELEKEIERNRSELEAWKTKKQQWGYLENCHDKTKSINFENFKQAKVNKWKNKFYKLDLENKSNQVNIIKAIFGIAKNALFILTACSGYGLALMPITSFAINIIILSGSLVNYSLKQSIKQVKIVPVKLTDYFELPQGNV